MRFRVRVREQCTLGYQKMGDDYVEARVGIELEAFTRRLSRVPKS